MSIKSYLKHFLAAEEETKIQLLEYEMKEGMDLLERIAKGDQTVRAREDTEDETVNRMSKFINLLVKKLQETMAEKDAIHQNAMSLAIGLSSHFEIMQKISKGDLSVKAEERADDPLIEQLGKITNAMVTALRENLIGEVQKSSATIAQASANMAHVSEKSSQTMSQLAGTITQISGSTTSIAQSAQHASAESNSAAAQAQKGEEAVRNLVLKMKTIDAAMHEALGAMERLNQRSAQIGEIVQVITKIADQTNLLSLNAAIEAARAGEVGKSFAVVADEVRKLAETSSNSAKQIQEIIQSVQKDTGHGVELVRRGAEEVSAGGILTGTTQEVFKEIAKAVQNVAKEIEQIAAGTEETAASSQEASAGAQEQNAALEEIASSGRNLAAVAKKLDEAAKQFKLN
ncbi:MAG: methyl-accepting chemotaxis protein [Elusimicrobia bacterium]|nr:methyl-accepting chemotaxis protein [Elusimicrobiota bacterium]